MKHLALFALLALGCGTGSGPSGSSGLQGSWRLLDKPGLESMVMVIGNDGVHTTTWDGGHCSPQTMDYKAEGITFSAWNAQSEGCHIDPTYSYVCEYDIRAGYLFVFNCVEGNLPTRWKRND